MIVKDKNVLVFGSGISGEAACALLLKEEAKVVLYDGNDKLNPEEIRAKIEGGDSESLEIILGTLEGDRKGELLDKLSLVVMSPGVPTDLPIVKDFQSGARSSLRMSSEKVMFLQLLERTERQRPLLCLEKL